MPTQRDRTLAVLRAAGDHGVSSIQFVDAGCGLRYGARLQELRADGFVIDLERVHRDSSLPTIYVYKLVSEPSVPSRRDPSGPLLGETTEARDGVRSASRLEETGGTLFDMPVPRKSAVTGGDIQENEAA